MKANNYLGTLIIIGFCVLLGQGQCLAGDIALPEGWRLPATEEIQGEETWRNEAPNKYLIVQGDFDGDGNVDEVRLLVAQKPLRLGLFVFLRQINGQYKTLQLDEELDFPYFKVLGIDKVHPGAYKTVCGKELVECGENEPNEVVLKYDGIKLFKFEGYTNYLYWEPSAKTFIRAYIDD